jgi:hypothetical protein
MTDERGHLLDEPVKAVYIGGVAKKMLISKFSVVSA